MSGGVRWSQEQLDEFRAKQLGQTGVDPAPPKKSKYSAVKTKVDGITFDSKKEAYRYSILSALRAAGEVKWFLMQVPFRLPGGTVYRLDFLVLWADGRLTYEDVKGFETQTFKIKKREVEHEYGITIDVL